VCGQWQQRLAQAAGGAAAPPAELAAARKLAPPLRAQLLAELRGGAQCVCTLCADLSEEPVIATCCHTFCRQCATLQARNKPTCRSLMLCQHCSTCWCKFRQGLPMMPLPCMKYVSPVVLAAYHNGMWLTAVPGAFDIAQVGALGSAAPDQAFDCPSCTAALTGAHIFSAAALAQASGPGASAAASTPASSAAAPASGPSSSSAHAEWPSGNGGSEASTKIRHMLTLLAEVKQRNEACAAGCGACLSIMSHACMINRPLWTVLCQI
jgi:hypothetical protein